MEKILVIEDDNSIRTELSTLLFANGYTVVDEPPCDLALLDINLPGESGYEICRKLRLNSDVPVIFLTARDSAEDEILGFGVGADDYIRKPYNSSGAVGEDFEIIKEKEQSCYVAEGPIPRPFGHEGALFGKRGGTHQKRDEDTSMLNEKRTLYER